MINEAHFARPNMPIRAILAKMRHDGCGGHAGKAEVSKLREPPPHGRSKWGRRRKFQRDGPSLDLGNERTRKGTAGCVESALAQFAKGS